MSLPEKRNNIFRNNLFLRVTGGAHKPNLQACYYACTARMYPASFRLALKMNGMHRMQSDHVNLQLLSLVINHACFDRLPHETWAKHSV